MSVSSRPTDKSVSPLPENLGVVVGLFAVAASTMLVEIALTKFIGCKVFHHMSYAVLSVVILSFGASGIFVYMKGPQSSAKSWELAWKSAALYSIFLALAIPLFCWFPLDPYKPDLSIWLKLASLPIYFIFFSVPLFFAGLCISVTLAASQRAVTTIYFLDLSAAAIGAAACPPMLVLVGGYGLMSIASALGILASIAYFVAAKQKLTMRPVGYWIAGIVSILGLLFYPSWAMKTYGFDISSAKDWGLQVVLKDFGGVAATHWNAIARIDVSKTATSKHPQFLYGLSPNALDHALSGRYILVDGGANTRQFEACGALSDQHYLGQALWASPYIPQSKPKNTLVIGGGGGIDVLIAKYFKTGSIDVAEINPSTYLILKGLTDDQDARYTRWLKSDSISNVNIFLTEARHFCTTLPAESYDIIQASGVDTLTAITTGGMSLVENYLYTVDAVRDYMRLLRPDGVLSLTHWRNASWPTGVRMFATYLQYLDSMGIAEPWKYVVVTADNAWADAMIKKTPFTPAELQRIRQWAQDTKQSVLFDPENRTEVVGDEIYQKLGFAKPEERDAVIKSYKLSISPVHDDKPYFYQFSSPNEGPLSLITTQFSVAPISLILLTILGAAVLVVFPLIRSDNRKLVKPAGWFAVFFALCGFAFFLYETAIIQMFSIFVGGPTYSLAIVLVCVLSGYALGSWISRFVVISSRTFLTMGVVLSALFISLYFAIPPITKTFLPLAVHHRVLICGVITFLTSVCAGFPVTLGMTVVRQRYGNVVAWMWAVNSAFNGIGSVAFVPITQTTGISSCLLIVAFLYLSATVLLACCGALRPNNQAILPVANG